MFHYIIFGTIVLSLTTAARLEQHYIPPNQNSISTCQCGPGSGQKSYQASYAAQSQPQPQQYQQAQTYQQPQYQQQQSQQQQIPILKYENNNHGDGSYDFAYETGNGISHQEQGGYRALGPEEGETQVMGSYSYTDTDGKKVTVNYKADANGFQATGDHLPTPPPIPPEIQESLKLTAPGYNPYQSGSTPQQSYGGHTSVQKTQTHYQPQMKSYNPQPQPYNPPQTYTQPQSHNQYHQQFASSSTNLSPQRVTKYASASTNLSPNGGTQYVSSSTNLLPNGVAVQSTYNSGSGQPHSQAAYASQSSFSSSPKNTYLPPF